MANTDLLKEIRGLESMTTGQLAERYRELHGQPSRTRHRAYLVRKIAWRLQANAEGDLTERARRRAAEIADDADVRVMAPATLVQPAPSPGSATPLPRTTRLGDEHHMDPRVPSPGSVIVREYRGRTLRVLVMSRDDGFEFEGERFRTLSAVAKHITGSHVNGFRFFRLGDAS